MPTQILPIPLKLTDGFYPTTAEVGPNENKNAARDGRNVLWLGPGLMRSSRGVGVVGVPAGGGGDRLFIVNDKVGSVDGVGSVVPFRSNSAFYLTVSSSSNIINVGGALYSGTGGRLRYTNAGGEFNSGLDAPTAAPVLISDGDGTITTAATSCQITRIRTSGTFDGDMSMNVFEESNPSPTSNSVAVDQKKIRFSQFPAVGTGKDAHDAWGIYVTHVGFGSIGGFERLRVVRESEILGSGSGRYIDLQWQDSELLGIAPPTNNTPPPTGMMVAELGGSFIVLGSRMGTHYAASKQGLPGAFPRRWEVNMSPPEPPIGMVGRPQEAELFVWTKNSLQSFILSGGETDAQGPVYNRCLWPQTGILSPMGGCFADRRFYCWISYAGPARLGSDGNPDTSFAQPIRRWLMDQNIDPSKVAVGYDPAMDSVVFTLGNDLALVYHQGLSEVMGNPIWSVPIEINLNTGASKTTLLTFEGKLIIGRNDALGFWELGTLDRAWYIDTHKQDAPNPMDLKTLLGYRAHFNADSPTIKLFIDDADPSGAATHTLSDDGDGLHYTDWDDALLNEPYHNIAFRIAGTHQMETFDDLQYLVMYTEGLRDAGL